MYFHVFCSSFKFHTRLDNILFVFVCVFFGQNFRANIQNYILLLEIRKRVLDSCGQPSKCLAAGTMLNAIGHCRSQNQLRVRDWRWYWPGVILDEYSHGGSRNWNRGWIAMFAHSNLDLSLMTRCDLVHKEWPPGQYCAQSHLRFRANPRWPPSEYS